MKLTQFTGLVSVPCEISMQSMIEAHADAMLGSKRGTSWEGRL